ncbi:TPA: hypothetical protein ACYR7L_000199 [Proteus mirabilis]
MKNPKLISKPFAQNGQKNVIPEKYETSMEGNQATWDQGFGQITMLPVSAGGLPPKGQDFNGILNQISETLVHISKGGVFKFSADYAAAINGYPKGAILQSEDEKKYYQSLIDNNKVNFNTASKDQIKTSWKLVMTDDLLNQLSKKLESSAVVQSTGTSTTSVMSQKASTDAFQPKGSYQPSGNYALAGASYTKTESDGRYQAKGSYATAGSSYTKAESDGRYQGKGNYQPAGNYALVGASYTKAESDGKYQPKGSYATAGSSYTKAESDGRYQSKGNYQPSGYSYSKAESDARYSKSGSQSSFVKIWSGDQIKGSKNIVVTESVFGRIIYARLSGNDGNMIGGCFMPNLKNTPMYLGFNNEYTRVTVLSDDGKQLKVDSGWGITEIWLSR